MYSDNQPNNSIQYINRNIYFLSLFANNQFIIVKNIDMFSNKSKKIKDSYDTFND
jgi:hypothetical protein